MDELTRIDAALALLRAAIGLTVAAHGYAKVFRGGRLSGTAAWFDSIGMRPGWMQARMAAYTEIGAGLLIALGLVTPIAALAIVSLMIVAAWTVHRTHGFFIVGNGWEYNFVLAVAAMAIATTGPGRIAVDPHFGAGSVAALDGWTGFLIAALGGAAAAVVHLVAFYRAAPADLVDAFE